MTANYRSEIDRRVKEAGIKEYKNIVMDLISSIEQELRLGFNYSYGNITKNLYTAENLVQVLADWRAKVKDIVDTIPITGEKTDKEDSSETDIEEFLKPQEAIRRRDITIDNLRKALLEKESVIHQLQASITDKEEIEEKYAQVIADKEHFRNELSQLQENFDHIAVQYKDVLKERKFLEEDYKSLLLSLHNLADNYARIVGKAAENCRS